MFYPTNFPNNRIAQHVEITNNVTEFIHDKLFTINKYLLFVMSVYGVTTLTLCYMNETLCATHVTRIFTEISSRYFDAIIMYIFCSLVEECAKKELTYYNATNFQKHCAGIIFGICKAQFLLRIAVMHSIFALETLHSLKDTLLMRGIIQR